MSPESRGSGFDAFASPRNDGAETKKRVRHNRARFCLPRWLWRASRPFELEGHVELGTIGLDLALGIELHVELDDFRDAKVAQCLRGPLDRDGRGLFPGFLAR